MSMSKYLITTGCAFCLHALCALASQLVKMDTIIIDITTDCSDNCIPS